MHQDQPSYELESILRELLRQSKEGVLVEEADIARSLGELQPLLVAQALPSVDTARLDAFFQFLIAWGTRQQGGFSPGFRQFILDLLPKIPSKSAAYGHLLTLLVSSVSPQDHAAFIEPFVTNPPCDPVDALRPLVALMRQGGRAVDVFPRLLAGLERPHVAPAILDLANALTRRGFVSVHPAITHIDFLIRQLQAIVAALEDSTTSRDPKKGASPYQVSEGISYAISFADTLALIGNPRAIPVLSHLAQLPHRRLRIEAEAALVRLGVEESKHKLIALAAEPVVRLHALKYAEELDLLNQVPEQYSSPVAIAAAELVAFLAQPGQLGFPPEPCELMDARLLSWPGYDEPRNCYLFRFQFPVSGPEGELLAEERVGIAGPMTFAFSADLGPLSPVEYYAAFAGYATEHDEIAEIRLPTSSKDIRDRVDAFTAELQASGHSNIRPIYWGSFFGDDFVIAEGTHDGHPGLVAIDRVGASFYPVSSPANPLTAEHALFIYKGKRLLSSFNPSVLDDA